MCIFQLIKEANSQKTGLCRRGGGGGRDNRHCLKWPIFPFHFLLMYAARGNGGGGEGCSLNYHKYHNS